MVSLKGFRPSTAAADRWQRMQDASSWLDELKPFGLEQLAPMLGYTLDTSQKALRPCPACNDSNRGSKDRRGVIGLFDSGSRWHCYRCKAGGDGIAFVVWHFVSKEQKGLSKDDWRGLRAACAEHGLCSADPTDANAPKLKKRRVEPKPVSPPEPPKRPPATEVAELWESCLPVDTDAECSAWLASRRLSAGVVADRDLARALPESGSLPGWCQYWRKNGHRLVLPLFNAEGEIESFHARLVRKADGPKGLPPYGYEIRGLAMADRLGVLLLKTGQIPGWFGQHDLKAIVAEGHPDFLTWSCLYSDADEFAPAVFGLLAGSWTLEHGNKIPAGSQVVVRRHDDPNGERYAQKVIDTLEHCTIFKSKKRSNG